MAASVRQKLLDLARISGRPFGELLQFYGMERFLYRLAQSKHKDKLILKGALMLAAWEPASWRPTMDIDFLGRLPNTEEAVTELVKSVCTVSVEDDGIQFDSSSLAVEPITEDADYRGLRAHFDGRLKSARVHMQLDIGFGDALVPGAETFEYPTLLSMARPILMGYTRESAIAEKLEAMIKLGMANSRMKDFYDVWLISRQSDFDGAVLSRAVGATFEKRKTPLSATPAFFSTDFVDNQEKQKQWRAYVMKNRLENAPAALRDTVDIIRAFLGPVLEARMQESNLLMKWSAGGSWTRGK